LASKERVSSTSSIFTLQPARSNENHAIYESAWRTGIWSVTFKQPQLQIGRDYTPLPPFINTLGSLQISAEDQSTRDGDERLRFLIRREPHGEVSRYLHGLEIGTEIEIRGPNMEYEISDEVKDIVFIAGGTGIAPALQAAYTLLGRTSDVNKPRMHILWASRCREDCLGGSNSPHQAPATLVKSWWWWWNPFKQTRPALPPPPTTVSTQRNDANSVASVIVKELENLKAQYPNQLTVWHFIDEENTFISKDSILATTGSTSRTTLTPPTSASPLPARAHPENGREKRVILISGPEGFISYLAGPKVWAHGLLQQGPLRGVIGELDLKGWSVWKL
jgi:ferredoxin-NADP reductase